MRKEQFANSWLDNFLIKSKIETFESSMVLCQPLKYWCNILISSTVL